MAIASPNRCIDLTDPYQLEKVSESVCVVAEKVYASCLQRECIPSCSVNLPITVGPYTFVGMRFENGLIVPDTTVITPLPNRPNFARVQFTVQIPFNLTLRDALGTLITLTGSSTDIFKDIILYYPPFRSEFSLKLRVETRAQILGPPSFTAITIEIPIGVFIITKVTGLVQILVPAFGYCTEPPSDNIS